MPNRLSLDTIDTALFVLALDSGYAPTASAIGQLGLCSNLKDRWADKSFTCLVFKNGVEGILCEVSDLKFCLFWPDMFFPKDTKGCAKS